MSKTTSRKKVASELAGNGKFRLHGLVVAAYTPFDEKGALNLRVVEKQAAHYLHSGLRTVFIGGSTGESHSLSTDERRALCQRWMDVARGTELRVVVHVGSNCLTDAAVLARQAQDLGGDCATVHIVLASSSVDPHDYEPTSADAVVFDTAQLVVVNGADYDLWASDLASNAASSPAVVDAGRSSAPPRARIRACGIRRGM